jgi:hypothetical protein
VPFGFQLHSVVLVAELRNFYGQSNSLDKDEISVNEGLVDLASYLYEMVTSNLNKFGGELI